MNRLARVAVMLTVTLGVLVPLAPASAGADRIPAAAAGTGPGRIRGRPGDGVAARRDAVRARSGQGASAGPPGTGAHRTSSIWGRPAASVCGRAAHLGTQRRDRTKRPLADR